MEVRGGPAGRRSRFLDGVERLGNALPDPIFIFVGIIVLLVIVSVIGAAAGWSAVNPVTGDTLVVTSLLSEENVQRLLVEMPRAHAVRALVQAPLEALTRQPLAAISSLEQQEDGVLLRCQADELPWMALSFAALPFPFRILEPDALAREIASHARQLLTLAGQAPAPD